LLQLRDRKRKQIRHENQHGIGKRFPVSFAGKGISVTGLIDV
jgi:hypothetical protein